MRATKNLIGAALRAAGLSSLAAALAFCSLQAQPHRFRTPIRIPNPPGYLTLKCDFHMHTVFSDGRVWPDVRVEEAWREGLDAIALTDHVEYQPHKADVSTNRNRAYLIAKPAGDQLGIIVIPGAEITRSMPPGHLNAIFITDANALDQRDWRKAVETAVRQGGVVFWNHPGWTGQQPDGVARWYPEHTELLEKGLLTGIEVVNHRDMYPAVLRWALEKNLAPLANSDIHPPVALDYDLPHGDRRPITLVFAKTRSAGAIKEALIARRTAAFDWHAIYGKAEWLRPIFQRSVSVINPQFAVPRKGSAYLQIRNDSDLDYTLKAAGPPPRGVRAPAELTLKAGKVVLCRIQTTGKLSRGVHQLTLPYEATNLVVGPEKGEAGG